MLLTAVLAELCFVTGKNCTATTTYPYFLKFCGTSVFMAWKKLRGLCILSCIVQLKNILLTIYVFWSSVIWLTMIDALESLIDLFQIGTVKLLKSSLFNRLERRYFPKRCSRPFPTQHTLVSNYTNQHAWVLSLRLTSVSLKAHSSLQLPLYLCWRHEPFPETGLVMTRTVITCYQTAFPWQPN